MSRRLRSALSAGFTLLLVASCTTSSGGSPSVASPAAPSPVAPSPTPSPHGSPSPIVIPPSPNTGNVDDGTGPVLSVEPGPDGAVRVTLRDPAAHAWRIVVAGTGDLVDDRLELRVETGDIAPSVEAFEIRDGEVVDVLDLSSLVDGTAVAGGCHLTLGVCVDSAGFGLPDAGDGTLSVRLTLVEASGPLQIVGATAGWPGEPFVLGPWRETTAFAWGT